MLSARINSVAPWQEPPRKRGLKVKELQLEQVVFEGERRTRQCKAFFPQAVLVVRSRPSISLGAIVDSSVSVTEKSLMELMQIHRTSCSDI